MESKPKRDETIPAAFSQRMAQNALEDQERYSLRTGTILDAHGFLDGVHHDEVEPQLLAVITNANHPARVLAPPGPLLFYRPSTDAPRVTCVEMPDLLLHPEQPVRAGAIWYFQQLGTGLLSKQTAQLLGHFAADAGSVGKDAWQTAAVRVLDAMQDDYLLSLAGLRQSLLLDHGEMVRKFVLRALNPSLSSVDQLGSEIMVVVTQPSQVAQRIDDIAQNSGSISDLCSAYFDAFGHVPLAKPFSLARTVGRWQRKSHSTEPAQAAWWQQVWSWVESVHSPLARYQALSLFVQRPDLLPAERRQECWKEILEFLEPVTEEPADPPPWREALKFRQATAIHYYDYLVCRATPLSEDVLGEWAWWMAERFCSCFGTKPELLERMRKDAVLPMSRRSAYDASLTPPSRKCSNLRLATRLANHLWSFALLNNIGGEFMATSPPAFSEAEAGQFVKQLYLHLAFAPLIVVDGAKPPAYAVDEPLIDTIRAWCAAEPQTNLSAAFQTLNANTAQRFDPEVLLERLGKLTSFPKQEQFSIVLTLRLLLSTGRAPNEALLARVSEPGWLGDAMHRLEPDVCEHLLAVFCTAPQPEHEAWLGWLYQLVAVCEQPALAAERRTLIFRLVVLACAVSDSTGPVSKLLNGPNRSLFSEDASVCRAKLEAAYPTCAQAVKATIRAITGVLHVA